MSRQFRNLRRAFAPRKTEAWVERDYKKLELPVEYTLPRVVPIGPIRIWFKSLELYLEFPAKYCIQVTFLNYQEIEQWQSDPS